MIHEINASAIIALLIKKSEKERVTIEINNVVSIGCEVEQKHPSVFVDTDRYSFQSFASISKNAIKVSGGKIIIDKTDDFLSRRLERMIPAAIVCKYIEEIIG